MINSIIKHMDYARATHEVATAQTIATDASAVATERHNFLGGPISAIFTAVAEAVTVLYNGEYTLVIAEYEVDGLYPGIERFVEVNSTINRRDQWTELLWSP